MNTFFKTLIGLVLTFTFLLVLNHPVMAQNQDLSKEETLKGTIQKILDEREIVEEDNRYIYQKLEIKITEGSLKGKTVVIENGGQVVAGGQRYNPGDKLIIFYSKDFDGKDFFLITDIVRTEGIFYLVVIFIVLVIGVGQIWGATSLVGMAFSFFVIFTFVLPRIISGMDPVLTAILGSSAIIPVTFILSHGLKRKTLVAMAGTFITLFITGVLAAMFVRLTKLTGFSAEEAGFLQFQLGSINMQGILLAGIIISSLGILDDITISQASIVSELRDLNKDIKPTELFGRAMKVGRDHISSLVNTLVLVYTGASLPLLLIFLNNPHPIEEIINYEIVATEIVKTLVGSIGLILAVPITTAIAVFYSNRKFLRVNPNT